MMQVNAGEYHFAKCVQVIRFAKQSPKRVKKQVIPGLCGCLCRKTTVFIAIAGQGTPSSHVLPHAAH